MPTVRKTISYAHDIGDRVYLVCSQENAPGIVTHLLLAPGYVPLYRVSFADGISEHIGAELSCERVLDFGSVTEDGE
jgi:hypothetical protein